MLNLNNLPIQENLSRKGVFYVGGQVTGFEGKHHWRGQMFVEVYVPKEVYHPWPLILFHGAGQTNVNWLTTPDGRQGWADWFVNQGYVVFLAEQPARGRSAYHSDIDGPTMYHSLESLWKRFASAEGEWPQARLHTQWPDMKVGRESGIFAAFGRSQVEYLNSNKKSQELVLACAKELMEVTGPAVLLTHSQAGPFGWLITDYYPKLVKGVVALEPGGPPFSADLNQSKSLNYGLAELPLHYTPVISDPKDIHLTKYSVAKKGLVDGWVFANPAPKLPNLAGIPIVIITSEASYHAQYDHLLSYVLQQTGVDHDFFRLEEHGIYGNGHMMMLEKNNLQIAQLINKWLIDHEL